jgi:hypothetical protein
VLIAPVVSSIVRQDALEPARDLVIADLDGEARDFTPDQR